MDVVLNYFTTTASDSPYFSNQGMLRHLLVTPQRHAVRYLIYVIPPLLCSRQSQTPRREREIYSHNAGNQKGFCPSKLAHITNNIFKHRLEQITQNVQT